MWSVGQTSIVTEEQGASFGVIFLKDLMGGRTGDSDSSCGRICRPTMKSLVVKGFILIIGLWFLILGMMSIMPVNNLGQNASANELGSASDTSEILERIDAALQEIQMLKKNNAEMKRIIESNNPSAKLAENHDRDDIDNNELVVASNPGDPSAKYEDTRRQLELNLKELWYSIRSKSDHLEEINFEQVSDIYRVLRGHLQTLRKSDGYEAYRERETKELARIVQSRIHSLQNPKNCDTAKKLVCSLNKGCGFGCQVHHVCYCLVVAYATSRTLILESRGWRYNRGGWDKVFLPLSDTCTSNAGESRGDWSGMNSDRQVVQLPIVDFLKPRPPFLPVAIPSDISERLEKVHGEPHVWWVGQFMKFILRPQPHLQSMLDEAKQKSGIQNPVVGLHIRRTDKIGTEASFHALKEYMNHAEEYFSIKEKAGMKVKRRVFIASDDPSVISEAKRAYPEPDWEILGDAGVAQTASLSQRYNGLNGIVRDVVLLSDCDFLVCTFSSQVCRLAYELLQTKHVDASERFVSLDDIYYYGGGIGLDQEAIISHKPRNDNELELQVGDKLSIAGNHWDGMSKGTNRRTNQVGLYPSYKARNKYTKINFPEKNWWSTSGEVRR